MRKKIISWAVALCAGASGQTITLSNKLTGPALGGSLGQTMRISVAADPSVRCMASAGFRKSDVEPPTPDKTFDLLPGQVGFTEINLGRLVTRLGQRGELVPAVKILDGKCSASAEVFEKVTGRVTAHIWLLGGPPQPDLEPP